MSTIVSFKDVSLNFGGVKALNNVSFDIKEGSLHAIIGPNGAGKTSIFNCISGIYKPCLLYTSPSPRDGLLSRMPSSA